MEGHFEQDGKKLHKIKKSSSGGTWGGGGGKQTNLGGIRGGSSPVPPLHFGKPCYPEMKSSEGKHLRIPLFYRNKDSRSKDQNRN